MSLRVRLVVVIVALVTVVAAALSILHLVSLVNSLTEDALQRSVFASQQVRQFVTDHIYEHAKEYEPPQDLDGTVALWNQIVSSDAEIGTMLEKTILVSPAIVEINVAGQTGQILASSNPTRVGLPLNKLEMFSSWRARPVYRRMIDLFTRRPDYQVNLELGIPGKQQIFTIQVVASSVLLRSALLPEVEWVGLVSLGALALSLVITAIAGNWVLLPLKRIEQTIERILQGKSGKIEKPDGVAKEFAVVENKLDVLGEQFRGARQEASQMQQSLEQLLERMESQLDVASRLTAISRITGGVAHEIKNPLNAISLHLDLLRERLGGPEEDLTDEIDILSKEVRRLDRVVKTFLDFSRPVDVKLEEIDLAALAREVTELMTPQARLANIEMTFEDSSGPAVMRGDSDMLKQAILNLVTNALDAMTGGGSLRMSVARAGDAVVLEIADNGPGIPLDLRSKVFQLYFTTKPKGSGIGLAMTYRAVQLHNGVIGFTSEDGRGTTFRLEFPALVTHA